MLTTVLFLSFLAGQAIVEAAPGMPITTKHLTIPLHIGTPESARVSIPETWQKDTEAILPQANDVSVIGSKMPTSHTTPHTKTATVHRPKATPPPHKPSGLVKPKYLNENLRREAEPLDPTFAPVSYPEVITIHPHPRPTNFYKQGHQIESVRSVMTFDLSGSPYATVPAQPTVKTVPTPSSKASGSPSSSPAPTGHGTAVTSTSKSAVAPKSSFSMGKHCPYPYPNEHCHPPKSSATTMKTSTKATGTSTAKNDCPYPGQKC